MPARPDPFYDLHAVLPAGQLLTRERELALAEAYAANGFRPLSGAQVVAAVGPAVAEATSMTNLQECGCV